MTSRIERGYPWPDGWQRKILQEEAKKQRPDGWQRKILQEEAKKQRQAKIAQSVLGYVEPELVQKQITREEFIKAASQFRPFPLDKASDDIKNILLIHLVVKTAELLPQPKEYLEAVLGNPEAADEHRDFLANEPDKFFARRLSDGSLTVGEALQVVNHLVGQVIIVPNSHGTLEK